MFNRVLFLCRKKCAYSKKLSLFLKKKSRELKVISLGAWEKPKKFELPKQKSDFIFSFRSTYILKKKHFNQTKIAAINFHPGPPEYRGIGCANFAILNNEKRYGVTAHVINKKIDNGKIIDVKYFKMPKKINLEKLLRKTHYLLYKQAVKIMSNLLKNPKNLKEMIIKNKKVTWSKKLYTKKEMLKLYYYKSSGIYDKKRLLLATKYKKYKISEKK